MSRKNLQGTWSQAIVGLLLPILGVLSFRWVIVEPFVIPSGSMIPTLLLHDHIMVKKWSYGIHLPGSTRWLIKGKSAKPGEIVVFRFPHNPDIYYVKRVVAVAGDHIEVREGQIYVNNKLYSQSPLEAKDKDEFEYRSENGHQVRYLKNNSSPLDYPDTEVPSGHFFVMGDNRDQSSDSRIWGFVPEENVVGEVAFIWLSCAEMMESSPLICNPGTIRWPRMFSSVH